MFLIILPPDLPSHPILHPNPKPIFLIRNIIALINPSKRTFFAKPIFPIFLPFPCIPIASLFILIHPPPISRIIIPFPIINKPIFIHPHAKQYLIAIKKEPIIQRPIFQLFFIKLQRIHSFCIFIQIINCLNNYFLYSYLCLANSHQLLFQCFILLFDLLQYPILFFYEVQLIEEHVAAFLARLKIFQQDLSVSVLLLVGQDFVYFLYEDLMADLFAEHLSYYFAYFLQFKTLLKVLFQLLGKFLLMGFFYVKVVDCFQQVKSYFVDFTQNSHCHCLQQKIAYIKSRIDILYHITHISLMLDYKLENFAIPYIKWPISQLLNITFPNFINSKKILIMNLMIFIKTNLTDKSCYLFTIWMNTNVKNLLTFMTWQQTFWSY